jgi:hypothetical protein
MRRLLLLLVFLCATASVHALGTEGHGNAPVPEGLLKGKATIDLANQKSRVYWREVNGDLRIFYRGGNTEALNKALQLLARVPGEARELILLPGPGETHTFDRTRVPCDWSFHQPGGFYSYAAKREKGTKVFTHHATLTVWIPAPRPRSSADAKQVRRWIDDLDSSTFTVRDQATKELEKLGREAAPVLREALAGKPSAEARRRIEALLERLPGIDLDGVRVPAGITVVEFKDLLARYQEGLKSAEYEVRGHAAGGLADLAVYSDETIQPTIELLKTEKHEYVRRYAASSLGQFGARAAAAVPVLKEGLNDADMNVKNVYLEAIRLIEKAEADKAWPMEAKKRQEIRDDIRAFCQAREKTEGQRDR